MDERNMHAVNDTENQKNFPFREAELLENIDEIAVLIESESSN